MASTKTKSVTTRTRAGRYTPDCSEAVDLRASEIACAVADAWITAQGVEHGEERRQLLFAALDRLEAITRPSAMRKVRESPLRKVRPGVPEPYRGTTNPKPGRR